ncbi:CAAX amino terminal protease self- immunity [Poriferisphaera corsica]|uniref:CAAX amino terminal protease self-immunity n=1 Tax=Poriferisphaera corsica TaxID=2528020 RepID=A0A517YQ29_9BACT|nr:CPBP family intramembrane glutamic endopeptidase [Poriferisphaera corsica]QDU32311.1 CAAX amino terminal protease self- immunity [Poriferisphaera corsica]
MITETCWLGAKNEVMVYADVMNVMKMIAEAGGEVASDSGRQVISSLNELGGQIVMIPVAVLIVGYWIWSKRLSRHAFDGSPRHLASWGVFDLLIVFGLWLMGGAVFSLGLVEVVSRGMLPGMTLGDGGMRFGSIEQQAAISLIGQLMQYSPPVWYVVWKCLQGKGGLKEFGLQPRSVGGDVLAGVLAFVAGMPVILGMLAIAIAGTVMLGGTVELLGHEILITISQSKSMGAIAIFGVSAIVVAPIVEEVLFRGAMQTTLFNLLIRGHADDKRMELIVRWGVVFVSAIVFMSIHMSAVPSWQPLVGHFTLGLILAWLYERRGSLWPCIILHALFNAFNFGFVVLQYSLSNG